MQNTTQDVLYMIIRLTLMLIIFQYLGFIWGLLLLINFKQLTSLFMLVFLGLEPLSTADELFSLDDDTNVCNIVSKSIKLNNY